MSDAGIKPWWNYKSFTLKGDAAHRLSVNTGNGNLVISVTDFVFASRVPAVLMRTYNSADATVIKGSLGYGWVLGWDEHLTSVSTSADTTYVDPTGAEYLYTFSGGHWTKPAGIYSELFYNLGTGNFMLTAPDGFQRIFSGSTGKLLSLIDANGNRLDFNYSSGKLDSITSPDGGVTTTIVDHFHYNGAGCLDSCGLTVPGGTDIYYTFGYDVGMSNHLQSVSDCLSQEWLYYYTVLGGPVTQITDPRSNLTLCGYTSSKLTSITDAASHATSFSYNTITHETTITDRNTNDTVVTHDGTNLYPTDIALPLSGTPTVTLGWDSGTLTLTDVTDPLTHVTHYAYDSSGNVTDVYQDYGGLNLHTHYTYDATYHCLREVELPLGQTTTFDYGATPAKRNVASITNPINTEVTYFDYNSHGDCTKVTDPSGQVTLRKYDEVYGVCTSVSQILDSGAGVDWALQTTYNYESYALWLNSTVNPDGFTVEYTRDEIGRVREVDRLFQGDSPPSPIATLYDYDNCGNLTTFTDANGHTTTYNYNNLNLLENVLQPETSTTYTTEYTYDNEENLHTVVRYADGSHSYTTTYAYDELNRLSTATLPEVDLGGTPTSPVIQYAYDDASRLTRKALQRVSAPDDAAWVITDYGYDDANRLTSETGPYYADTAGTMDPPPTDPPTPYLEYGYDGNSRLTTLTGTPIADPTPASRVYTYAYDDDGRLISVTDPLSGVTEYAYYPNSQLYRMRLPRQQAEDGPYSRTYTYDSVGRTTAVADALGYAQRYTYFNDGRLHTATDVANSLTTYSYDGVGRLLRTDYGLGSYMENEYASSGDLLQAVNGPANDGSSATFRTEYSYDARNRVTQVDQVLRGSPDTHLSTLYAYDQLDRLVNVTSPRDSENTYTYDGMSRLTEAVIDIDQSPYSGFNYTFDFGYDLLGRLVQRTNPDTGTQSYVYDAQGHTTSMTDPEGYTTTAEYDDWGMLATNTFADGGYTEYTYDDLGRQTSQTNALNEEYGFSFDANGNNTRLTTPYGATTDFTYNERDELVQTVTYPTGDERGPNSPDAKIELFSYNPAGQLVTYTGPGNEQWTFWYDALGRWTKASNSLGQTCQRAYTPNNCLSEVYDLQGKHFTLTYDSLNRKTLSTYNPGGGDQQSMTFDWDSGYDLHQVTDTQADTVTTLAYDRLGRITSSTVVKGMDDPLETDYAYNWRGQLAERTLPEFVDGYAETEDYSYDLKGLLTQVDYSSTMKSVQIWYDPCGRQAGMSFPGGALRSFSYNVAGRMVSDAIMGHADTLDRQASWQTLYGYDGAGNRISQTRDRQFWGNGTSPAILPAVLPTDEYGDPLIPTRETGAGPGRTWDAIPVNGNATPPVYTLNWEQVGDVQTATALNGATIVSQLTATWSASGPDETSFQLTFGGTSLPAWTAPGHLSILPALDPRMIEPQQERRTQDPLYNLDDTGSLPPLAQGQQNTAGQTQDNGNTDLNYNGQPLVSSQARRAEVQTQIGFNATLQGQQQGTVPALGAPWNLVTGTSGLPRLEVVTPEEAADAIRRYENSQAGKTVKVGYDAATGQISSVAAGDTGSETTLAEFSYDGLGRRIEVTDNSTSPPTVGSLARDWLKDELDFIHHGPDAGQGWGHGPGFSRLRNEDATAEAWYARGPQGQVRWTIGGDGVLQTGLMYNAWGANSGVLALEPGSDWPPHTMPAFLDNDERLLLSSTAFGGGLPTWKQGPGVAADATPLVGPLASPAASGGAGQGASGNPLTPAASGSTNLSDGNPWKFDPDDPYGVKHWIDGENWARNGGQWGTLPGAGTDKSPIGAPPAGLDTSSIADNRLASLWSNHGLSGSSEYHGVKPGQQTGSPDWDDNRNQRAPLPGVNGAGSGRAHGPVIPPLKPLPVYLPIEIWPPVEAPSSQWGDPQVPNAGSGGEKGGGDTHKGKGKDKQPKPSTGAKASGKQGKHEKSTLQKGYEDQNNDWQYLHEFNQDFGNAMHTVRTAAVNSGAGAAGPGLNMVWDTVDQLQAKVQNWQTGVRKKLGNAMFGPGYSAVDDKVTDVVTYAQEMGQVGTTILGAGEFASGRVETLTSGVGGTTGDAIAANEASEAGAGASTRLSSNYQEGKSFEKWGSEVRGVPNEPEQIDSISGKAKYRVLDTGARGEYGDYKHVQDLTKTDQLEDFALWGQREGKQVNIWYSGSYTKTISPWVREHFNLVDLDTLAASR
jgi:YD repeat-containing protein